MSQAVIWSSSDSSGDTAPGASLTPPSSTSAGRNASDNESAMDLNETRDLFFSTWNESTDSEDMRDAVTYEFVRSQRQENDNEVTPNEV